MEEMVVEALFNGDREAQIMAAMELSKMTSGKRKKLGEKGVIVPLISMMICFEDYEVVEAALNALLGLAFGSERNKARIAKSGAIPIILKLLLHCQNVQLLDLAMAALLTLSSLQAKLDAIATLHNLSTCHQIIPLMVTSGIIVSLLHLIHSTEKSSDLVSKAMSLLEMLVSSSEIALQETGNTSWAIQVLVETIEDGSPECKENAVTVLFLICRSCRDKYRGLILKEGAMPGLLQLSIDGTTRARDVAKDLLLLLRKGKALRLVEQMISDLSI